MNSKRQCHKNLFTLIERYKRDVNELCMLKTINDVTVDIFKIEKKSLKTNN